MGLSLPTVERGHLGVTAHLLILDIIYRSVKLKLFSKTKNKQTSISVAFFLDELDSYMYQTVGHDALSLYSDAIGLPLYRRTIKGSSFSVGADYKPDAKDEVEDLYLLLEDIKVNTFHIQHYTIL